MRKLKDESGQALVMLAGSKIVRLGQMHEPGAGRR